MPTGQTAEQTQTDTNDGGQPYVKVDAGIAQSIAPKDEPAAWAGDVASLDKEEWFTKLDEPTRKTVRGGVETRLKNYEKGIQAKLQTTAAERKEMEARLAKAERAGKMYDSMWKGEEDPRLAEYEAKLAAYEAERASLTTERDEFKSKWNAHAVEQAQREAQAVFEKHKDIMDNDEAYGEFHALIERDVDPDKAAKMVRALFPDLGHETRIPKDVQLASPGDGAGNRATRDIGDEGLTLAQKIERSAEKALRLHG